MSPSPSEALAEAPTYRGGWAALNRSLRAGASWSGREPNSLFLNPGDGTGRFLDASTALGFDLKDDGRALVPLDWDGDGDLDLATTARTGPRFRLLRNDLVAAPRAVELEFERLDARTVGARVELVTRSTVDGSSRRIVRVLRAGDGYLSVDAPRVHLGLGADEVASVRLAWPGAEPVTLRGVDGPGRYRVTTGGDEATRVEPRATDVLTVGPLVGRASDAAVTLAAPVSMPRLTMRSSAGADGALFGVQPGGGGTGAGRPVLVLLWASWCEPCLEELARLAHDTQVFDGEAMVLALSLDEPDAEAEAFRLLEALDWPGRSARATGESARVVEALFGVLQDRRDALALPAALVVDADGALVALRRGAWHGPVTTPALAPRERRDAAALEGGRWLRSVASVADAPLAARLGELEVPEAVREQSFARLIVGDEGARVRALVDQGLDRGRAGDLAGALVAFERALLLDPEDEVAQRNLAVALHRAGRTEEARRAYRRAVRLDPEDAASWAQLARISVETGEGDWREGLAGLRAVGSPLALDLKRWVRSVADSEGR